MLKDKTQEVVHRMNDVSFPELVLRFPEASGNGVFCGDNESLIVWEGLSEECIEALHSLVADGKIFLRSISEMDALLIHATVHKGGLNYPVAKQIKQYTRPHWIPALICKPSR